MPNTDIIDLVAELRKEPADELKQRAADEIEHLRGLIFRYCNVTDGKTDADRAAIELAHRSAPRSD